MSGPRIDATLPVPPGPGTVSVLRGLEGVLALPGPASASRFLLEGEAVRVDGWERSGIESIRIAGRSTIAGLSTTAGSAANVVVTPLSIRRELIGPQGTTQETILAPPSQRAVAIQWRGTAPQGQNLAVRFTVAPGATEVRYRIAGHALVVRAGAEAADHVVLVHPPPSSWSVVEADEGGVTVVVEAGLPPGTAVTMAVVAAGEDRPPASSVLDHLRSHEQRALSPPWEGDGLRLATGVAELDEGMGWLSARLRYHRTADSTPTSGLLWWGLGSLACGHVPAAQRAFELLRDNDPGGTHTALLAARIASVTGNQRWAQEVAEHLTSAGVIREAPIDRLTALTWTALADALRYGASEEDLAELRRGASSPPRTPGRLALPMAGASPHTADLHPWLAELIEHAAPDPAVPDSMAGAFAAIRSLSSGAVAAYGDWRGLMAAGLRDGPSGRGTWDMAGSVGTPVAGALACGMMHGLLGWDPDAPVGRLGLAPSFPPHLTAFAVHGVPVGDGRVSVTYRRQDSQHIYAFEPTRGRVPPTLVVEPRVVAERVSAVHVDERPAELNVTRVRDRLAVSVQLPLDGPRTIRLTTMGEGH